MSNSSGTYLTTRDAAMKAFDRLPAALRQALREATYDWAAQPLLKAMKVGGSPNDIARRIRVQDREELQMDAYRLYGPTHPQADNLGKRLKRNKLSIW